MSQHSHTSDRSAAYTGLILGVIALGIMVYGIVMLTNNHFNAEKGGKTEAGAVK